MYRKITDDIEARVSSSGEVDLVSSSSGQAIVLAKEELGPVIDFLTKVLKSLEKKSE